MDPVFTPQITFVNDAFYKDASEEILENLPDLEEECDLLEEVLDFKDSDAYKDGSIKEFTGKDIEIVLEENKEPGSNGTLKTAVSLADALVLQYYEEADLSKASFGHELSEEDWLKICEIKDGYIEAVFGSDLVSKNVAHPLLKEIKKELNNEDRVFTFLCGHDSNIGTVLSALDCEDYCAPYAIETRTPIGGKVVFEKWRGKDGVEYVDILLVYASACQIRGESTLTLNAPPVAIPLRLKGLPANRDGLYTLQDLQKRIDSIVK